MSDKVKALDKRVKEIKKKIKVVIDRFPLSPIKENEHGANETATQSIETD